MKIFMSLAFCSGLSLLLIGCAEPADTPEGGDARQARKAEELGGSPENPAPGQFDPSQRPDRTMEGGGDPDRQ